MSKKIQRIIQLQKDIEANPDLYTLKEVVEANQKIVDAKKQFMKALTNEFGEFVQDQMEEGYDEDFEDHFDFLKSCLDVFIGQKVDELI